MIYTAAQRSKLWEYLFCAAALLELFGYNQRKRDDNKNKFALFRGGWAGGEGGKLWKMLFFMGNVITIKI